MLVTSWLDGEKFPKGFLLEGDIFPKISSVVAFKNPTFVTSEIQARRSEKRHLASRNDNFVLCDFNEGVLLKLYDNKHKSL